MLVATVGCRTASTKVALHTWPEPVIGRSRLVCDHLDRLARIEATTTALTCIDAPRSGGSGRVRRALAGVGRLRLPARGGEPLKSPAERPFTSGRRVLRWIGAHGLMGAGCRGSGGRGGGPGGRCAGWRGRVAL